LKPSIGNWLTISTFGALILGATSARANPLDTFGFGSRGTAMGGAVAADSGDFSAGYYNPANLAQVRRLDISVGYFSAIHHLQTNGHDNAVDPVRGLVGGFVAPGKLFGVPFAFGIAVHLPDDRLSRVRALRQETVRWELYDNRNQRLYLAANLALTPFQGLESAPLVVRSLEIGGGISFMSSTTGRLDITGSANILRPDESQLRHEVEASLGAIRYPQFGARFKVHDNLALALVYRGQFQLDLDIRARLQGDLVIGGVPQTTAFYALRAQSVDAFLPQQVVLGSSWHPNDDLKVNLDFTWVNWSAYVPPVAKLDVALDIPPPPSGFPNGIMPPTTPAPTHVVKMDVHDRIVPHLGVEWRALSKSRFDGFIRGGYEYAKSPIGEQTGVTNYLDRDRHSVSLGLGFKMTRPLGKLVDDIRFDVHGQLSILPEGVTHKSDPADFVGDYVAGGQIWNLGTTISIGF
jgi:long-chain fatty acid transport protein